MDSETGRHEHRKEDGLPMAQYALIIALVGLMAFNQFQLGNLAAANSDHYSKMVLAASSTQRLETAGTLAAGAAPLSQAAAAPQAATQQIQTGAAAPAQIDLQTIADKVIPKGVPTIYGPELKVTFDDPITSMAILAKLDDGNGMADATMNARYVKIASMIACEYCCGATTLVASGGQAACGCAHSYAMRGLAKYLISKHGKEYTDDQILAELGKWKTMFFPKQHLLKAVEFANAGKDINTIDLTSNKFRGFKAAAAAPATSSGAASGSGVSGIANLPNMVGGC